MKKLVLSLVLSITAISAMGQTAQIKVQYNDVSPNWMSPGELTTRKMLLLAGAEDSKYFNTMSQYVDSMTSTPEGQKQLREMQMKAWITQSPDGSITVNKNKGNVPNKTVNTYIVKKTAEGIITVYDEWAMETGVYTEPFDEMKWTIVEDSTKKVLDYECILAETDYHGRRWKAWFTPEIPVQDGPWKFHGLPGLILLAETEGAPFRFEATGIEATQEAIPPMYKTDSYSKIDRKKALSNEDYGNNHREAMIKARFGGNVTIKNTSKSSIPKFEKEKHSIETDY